MTDRQCPFPASKAGDHLTGAELQRILTQFRVKTAADCGDLLLYGVVWQYENRHGPVSWATVLEWTGADVQAYFPPEPLDPEADAARFPASDSGPG